MPACARSVHADGQNDPNRDRVALSKHDPLATALDRPGLYQNDPNRDRAIETMPYVDGGMWIELRERPESLTERLKQRDSRWLIHR